jgi:hypothetical protein
VAASGQLRVSSLYCTPSRRGWTAATTGGPGPPAVGGAKLKVHHVFERLANDVLKECDVAGARLLHLSRMRRGI